MQSNQTIKPIKYVTSCVFNDQFRSELGFKMNKKHTFFRLIKFSYLYTLFYTSIMGVKCKCCIDGVLLGTPEDFAGQNYSKMNCLCRSNRRKEIYLFKAFKTTEMHEMGFSIIK